MNLGQLDQLEQSLNCAFKFIKDSRNPDGLWSDFSTLAGESVYWVSGYVGFSMSSYSTDNEGWLEDVALRIGDHEQKNGGWGYGPWVPADADSTSWCLRFLTSLKKGSPEIRERARQVILQHQNKSDGGFRTYFSPHDIARFMGLNDNIPFEGWLSSQLCVTPVAIKALMNSGSSEGIEQALNLIRESQTLEGFWNSYWWSGNLYATVHCMEALELGRKCDNTQFLNRAQDWIADTQLSDGSWSNTTEKKGIPFWTALALRGLLLKPRQDLADRIEKGINWLINNQLADGSWAPAYILRIPFPSMKEPWKQNSWDRDGRAINALIKDHKRLFSTATVIISLSEFKDQLTRGVFS